MEESVRNRLITKCQQLTNGMNVRTLNVMRRLLKDVEGQLLPLILGTADIRYLPQCGEQTSRHIERIIDELRHYYQQLTTNPQGDDTTDDEPDTYLAPQPIHLRDTTADMDRLLQTVFNNMVAKMTNVRARNLVMAHIKNYKDVEHYLNDSMLMAKWYGSGRASQHIIKDFLRSFHKEYLRITDTSNDQPLAVLVGIDFPFLSHKQQQVVNNHLKAVGTLPMFYIAAAYIRQCSDRQMEVIARISGIMGHHDDLATLAQEYGVTRERVRQLSMMRLPETCPYPNVWDRKKWERYPFFNNNLLTPANTDWEHLKKREHVEDLDFYAALIILSQMRTLNIVTLRTDGTNTAGRRTAYTAWEEPKVIFAYEKKYDNFPFTDAIAYIGHKASLKRIKDSQQPIEKILNLYSQQHTDRANRMLAENIIREVAPMYDNVSVEDSKLIISANSINYTEEFYSILDSNGKPMTINDIYSEFRSRHPADHHTNSTFVRNYMLRDNRFEAVGSKSTYQLRQWGLFAGALGDLAKHLLEQSDVPIATNELCRQMAEQRNNTTLNSCATSIYLAVLNKQLLYYTDTRNATACVGLPDRSYDDHYWPSPSTVEGAVRSMKRFIKEQQRWPFSSGNLPMESSLYYTMRKYAKKLHVSDEEWQYYHDSMADIEPDHYPANEHEMAFVQHCRELTAFCKKFGRRPYPGELPQHYNWFRSTQQQQLDGCRKFFFEQLLEDMGKAQLLLPPLETTKGVVDGKQLTIIFES